jgi:hypothetical protein
MLRTELNRRQGIVVVFRTPLLGSNMDAENFCDCESPTNRQEKRVQSLVLLAGNACGLLALFTGVDTKL